jgi:hypothetical protein
MKSAPRAMLNRRDCGVSDGAVKLQARLNFATPFFSQFAAKSRIRGAGKRSVPFTIRSARLRRSNLKWLGRQRR